MMRVRRLIGRWLARAGLATLVLGLQQSVFAQAVDILPGSTAYEEKRAEERRRIERVSGPMEKARRYMAQAETRVDEMVQLAGEDDYDDYDSLAEDYTQAVTQSIDALQQLERFGREEERALRNTAGRFEKQLAEHTKRLNALRDGVSEEGLLGLGRAIDASLSARERAQEARIGERGRGRSGAGPRSEPRGPGRAPRGRGEQDPEDLDPVIPSRDEEEN